MSTKQKKMSMMTNTLSVMFEKKEIAGLSITEPKFARLPINNDFEYCVIAVGKDLELVATAQFRDKAKQLLGLCEWVSVSYEDSQYYDEFFILDSNTATIYYQDKEFRHTNVFTHYFNEIQPVFSHMSEKGLEVICFQDPERFLSDRCITVTNMKVSYDFRYFVIPRTMIKQL